MSAEPRTSFPIRRVAVLGAGNMGSRIAAHFANAGVPVFLFDISKPSADSSDKAARDAIVNAALDALKKAKPPAFFEPGVTRLITTGNFDDDLNLISGCDWIIEAVTENLEIKRALLAKVSAFRHKHSIVTTNTSGLPIAQIAVDLPADFKSNWFGTHFFNPPRYMRLLEIIPTDDTNPAAINAVAHFADKRLGKTIVKAKDTPNFIGNRIGTFALLNTIRVMQSMDLSIEQVDALTGAILGWPKTGTFRLADLVGIDILVHVAENFFARVQDERTDVALPSFIGQMMDRKWLGDKTGQGFYKKLKASAGEEQRLGLDWKTLEYRPSERAKFPTLELAKNIEAVPERLKALLNNDARKDPAAAFYWQILPDIWNYSAHRVPEISDDIVGVDLAMKAGFNWELGPFEMWDAAGVPSTAARMKASGVTLATAVQKLLDSGNDSWYKDDPATASGRVFFDIASGEYRPVGVAEGMSSVKVLKKARGVVKKNPGASLIDLGNGIACLEFHSKMNAIGGDILALLTQTLKPDSEAVTNFEGFVISGDATNFSVGANLMQLLLSMQEEEWDEIGQMIKSFQDMTQLIKFCPRPVVVAPFGLCLGGGAEVALHGAARQAHSELYLGLVETGVGLIPGGGGCKEMTLRAVEGSRSDSVELTNSMRRYFEAIAMATVSTSAADARRLGYLTATDRITMNRDRLLSDAKSMAREMADIGFSPPAPRNDIPAPGENILASLKMGVHMMREGDFISDHDVKVANHVAHIICGGKVTPGTLVSEQYFLDLEREAFLSLCGEKKTQERIAFTLKTGKPLRN